MHEKAFHILPADVKHEAYLRTKFLRRTQMGKRLHLSAVGVDCHLDNAFAITRRHHRRDVLTGPHFSVKRAQFFDDRLQRQSFVTAVSRV